jgi:2-oxo-3-hexenedioate decarboxylase
LAKPNIDNLAELLNEARRSAKPVPQLSKTLSSFPRADAYSIQEKQRALRVQSGEHLIGWKMGLTSQAKREQMKLDSPLYGFLTETMQVQHNRFSLKGTIHPKIEPEIAFRIDRPLSGKVSRETALEACGAVAACMEILDSRYDEFKYFSMEDVIADNSSSSHFVLGRWVTDFRSLPLHALEMKMWVNGAISQSGRSDQISGDPVLSIVQLCALLAERGESVRPGSIVLAGAATAAVALAPGMQVALHVDRLPHVTVNVE